MAKIINVGRDFSRFPVGRYEKDSKFSGESFRENILRPALVSSDSVEIHMDDAFGYGSSFLEEVFGGIVRHGYSLDELAKKLKILSSDESLIYEIKQYMDEAASHG